jgi:hypothetical protein
VNFAFTSWPPSLNLKSTPIGLAFTVALFGANHARNMSSLSRVALIVLLGGSAVLSTVPAAYASCPSYSVQFNGFTYTLSVTARDGSCPAPYSNSTILHLDLSTGVAQNPYTVTLSCSTPGCASISNIIILGWGNFAICGTSQSLSGPPCASGPPWTHALDATVQANTKCGTAPLKINGASGQPDAILEAGLGCLGVPKISAPELPGSPVLLGAAVLPILLLLAKIRQRPA